MITEAIRQVEREISQRSAERRTCDERIAELYAERNDLILEAIIGKVLTADGEVFRPACVYYVIADEGDVLKQNNWMEEFYTQAVMEYPEPEKIELRNGDVVWEYREGETCVIGTQVFFRQENALRRLIEMRARYRETLLKMFDDYTGVLQMQLGKCEKLKEKAPNNGNNS